MNIEPWKRHLIGKKIVTSGNLLQVPVQESKDTSWYQIFDEYKSIFALVPRGVISDHYSKISGILKKSQNQLYLEVQEIGV